MLNNKMKEEANLKMFISRIRRLADNLENFSEKVDIDHPIFKMYFPKILEEAKNDFDKYYDFVKYKEIDKLKKVYKNDDKLAKYRKNFDDANVKNHIRLVNKMLNSIS